MGTGSLPGVKWHGRRVDQVLPSSAEVKERVGLFIPLLPLWAFVACCRVNFTVTFTFIDKPKDKEFLQQFSVSLTAKLKINAQTQIKYSGIEVFLYI